VAIRRKRVESLARELLATNGTTEPPISVEGLAKSVGIEIYLQPLDSDLSGFLYRDGDHAVIGVNSHHARVRQRFTVGHELGHYFLHDNERLRVDRAVQARFRSVLSSTGTDTEEIEANLFAAEVLMPREFVAQDLGALSSVDILDERAVSELAKRYSVSSQAFILRLVNLGYIDQ
jgi:Zn-dependent peptidase ImmA (M78 family)